MADENMQGIDRVRVGTEIDPWHARQGAIDPWRSSRSPHRREEPVAPPTFEAKRAKFEGTPSASDVREANDAKMRRTLDLLSTGVTDLRECMGQRIEQLEQDVQIHNCHLKTLDDKLEEAINKIYVLEGKASEWEKDQTRLTQNVQFESRHFHESGFDQAPDPACVSVSGEKGLKFSRSSLNQKLNDLCLLVGIEPSEITIEGKGLRKRFNLTFKGAAMAKCFLDSLLDDDGKWIPVNVLTSNGGNLRVYFNKAKSKKQEKTEILSGAIGRIIREQLGEDFEVFVQRATGVVSVDWVPVACLSCPTPDEVIFQWNLPEVERIKLDKGAALEKFKAGGRPPVAWSTGS
jgi:hypothetical protein